MAALFFSVPLYVVVVTSFKSMDEVRHGEIFALPHLLTLASWKYAWFDACSGMRCETESGLASSTRLMPSLVLSISLSMLTGYAMAL
jgi:glucose/mannose transport system permease protein